MNPDWLLDLPQDDITIAASDVAGAQKLSDLVAVAEAEAEQLTVAKLATLAARRYYLAGGGPESLVWFKKAEVSLVELSELSAAEVDPQLRDNLDRLEITVLWCEFVNEFQAVSYPPLSRSPGRRTPLPAWT